MKVLVTYASKYGSTRAIAEFIAEKLRERGAEAEVQGVAAVLNPCGYDAFVIGSAAYMGHWLKEAREFVSRNHSFLASRPVWLFSSGPLGTETKDAQDRDVRDAAVPKEIDEIKKSIMPRDHRVFFGALDSKKLSLGHKTIRRMPAARKLMPEGDFRDWKDVEAWVDEIATGLKAS